MEAKRTVTVDLMGLKLTVRTTEPEEHLRANIARVARTLEEIRAHTDTVDTARLFALGLLHLGRELTMLEDRHTDLCEHMTKKLDDWAIQVRPSQG